MLSFFLYSGQFLCYLNANDLSFIKNDLMFLSNQQVVFHKQLAVWKNGLLLFYKRAHVPVKTYGCFKIAVNWLNILFYERTESRMKALLGLCFHLYPLVVNGFSDLRKDWMQKMNLTATSAFPFPFWYCLFLYIYYNVREFLFFSLSSWNMFYSTFVYQSLSIKSGYFYKIKGINIWIVY